MIRWLDRFSVVSFAVDAEGIARWSDTFIEFVAAMGGGDLIVCDPCECANDNAVLR